MRIVYALTSLGVGGAERQALAIADRMVRRGHSVALLVLKPVVNEEWPTSLPVVHLDIGKSAGSVVAGVMRAWRFVREFRPDIVHSHSFHANILARALTVLVRGHKVICTVHNVYEGSGWRMFAYRLTDGLACRTTAVSQAAADRFIRLKAVNGRKCMVILNGIDTDEFAPDMKRRGVTRDEMEAGESFVWIATGRLVAAKDYPNMLRAFGQVRVAIPGAQLWIAGEPADAKRVKTEDGRIGTVFGFVTEHGQMERVRLLSLRRDVPALLDGADAFVSSSAWEGMPLAVGEAMVMEKPVVATDVGGTRELVGDAGTIVQAGDSAALAAAMIGVMQQTVEQRKASGQAARVRIVTSFSMDERADEWESLYRSVVDFEL
jgi:glycosyltransferase involved in cell wall biosynthesis